MNKHKTLSIVNQLQEALVIIEKISDELNSVDITDNSVIKRLLGHINFFTLTHSMTNDSYVKKKTSTNKVVSVTYRKNCFK
ncbi:hypothetical protein [Fangia hongkongensis]|uniref:hypothetical protein n=1 Tax=Fangia hongkongensis TaxID=270495 RepID=UPI00036D4595|nr:hypothetical protein [Fangia hongkongensis]MBK2124428.1 hypothetical protein [Fangia hongkongensis]